MKIRSRREKGLVFGISLTCILLVSYAVLIGPFLREWRHQGEEISLLEAKLKQSAGLIQEKESLAGTFRQYAARLKVLDPDQMRTQTLADLEKMTREQSLRVIEMKPLAGRRQGAFQEHLIEISLEGSMAQLLQFIYQLQETSGVMRVERLQMSAKGSQPSQLKALFLLSRLSKNQ